MWYGQKKAAVTQKSEKGSGVIGCFVNRRILLDYNVVVIDSSYESIM